MQTQIEPQPKPAPVTTVAELDQQIEVAKAQLVKLTQATADTVAEAQRWRTAFEHEPTAETDSNARIWSQKAKNAEAAVEQHEQGVVWKLEAQKKELQFDLAEAALNRQQDAALAKLSATKAAFVTAARLLDEAMQEFRELGKVRLEAQQVGYQPVPLRFDNIVRDFGAALAAELFDYHVGASTHAAAGFHNSNTPFVQITINRPASAVPSVYR
ncbi:MAG TPA: hypothetical protein VJN18_14830 [Polyangiaceae bacterium]|nr:hypothetical protein [Polyangiaceae bacterium]